MTSILTILIKLLLLLLIVTTLVLSIAILRTVMLPSSDVFESCKVDDADYIFDNRGLSKRLSKALTFKTITYNLHEYNIEAMKKFIKFIDESFPLVHSSPLISRKVVNNLSLLYHVKGSNEAFKPYLLAGHMDVVPVEESQWQIDPFSGKIKDGYIWGRGSVDCKHIIMGILEALEFLLENNYKPQRSFYIAFGHDEEAFGYDGAQEISKILKSQNIQLEYILDEGPFIFDNFIPGIKSPVAFIGVSEKGSLNLNLKTQSSTGHSSLPHKETAITILAKAVSKLEGDIFPSMFGKGPEEELFQALASCAPFLLRVVFHNLWLFTPIIKWQMNNPIMNSIHKTTTAVTMISGGIKGNVLPDSASAHVNLRVHPAQTTSEATEYVRHVISDDRVNVSVMSEFPPHPFSPLDSFGYKTIKQSVKQIHNDSCVAPIVLVANTDTKWYLELTKAVYRFSPVRIQPKDASMFHGHNEKIAVHNYVNIVNFYLHIIKNSDLSPTPNHSHSNEL